jgi:integrase
MTEATASRRRRPRGEGSIYQSKADGRWHAAIVAEDPETGSRVRRVVSAKTYAEVKAKLRDLRKDVDEGRVAAPQTQTLAAYVATWLPAHRGQVRASTYRSDEQYLRLRVLPSLGALKFSAITPTHVEKMTAAIVAGTGPAVSIRGRKPAPLPPASPTTARGARTALRSVLRDAQRDGLVLRNAAALARPPRLIRHELKVLAADQTKLLIKGTTEDALGPLYAVAATTGMRQGEVLGLRWTDVALESPSPTLTVRRALALTDSGYALAEPKTSRSRRTIDLPPITAAALRRERTRQKERRLAAGEAWQDRDGLVFTDAVGRPLDGRWVTHAFSNALARLGLPHVRFHDLRHGAASMMLASGVPLKTVSEQLGHSSIVVTADVYAHVTKDMRRDAAEAIERAIGGEK